MRSVTDSDKLTSLYVLPRSGLHSLSSFMRRCSAGDEAQSVRPDHEAGEATILVRVLEVADSSEDIERNRAFAQSEANTLLTLKLDACAS